MWTRGDTEAEEAAGGVFPGYQLRAGLRFGPCVTVRPLGSGGMGEVWLARNEAEGREEAVKVLKDSGSDPLARARFIREAKAALSLGDDDKVVRTFDVGDEGGRLYIRMEYVRGTSLSHRGRLTPVEALPLLKQLAASLAVGHARGVVHRDVKPSNFMVTPEGRVKLMDFGIARIAGAVTLTATGSTLGTPAYMSPEQWKDPKSVDARSDVYSLGVACYRVLTGRYPYDADPRAPGSVFYAMLLSQDPIPIERMEGLPDDVPPVIMRCLAKDPAQRYPDAAAVHDALRLAGRRLERSADTVLEGGGAPARDGTGDRRAPRGGTVPRGGAAPRGGTFAEGTTRSGSLGKAARALGVILLLGLLATGASEGWTLFQRRSLLADARAHLASAEAAAREACDWGAAGDAPRGMKAALRALERLRDADVATTGALRAGATPAETQDLARAIERDRAWLPELARAFEALAQGKAAEARAALDSALSTGGDAAGLNRLRARLDGPR